MLRELQVTKDKPANAQYKSGADENIITGMAVTIDEAAGTFNFVSASTATDLYFVDKERIPTGTNAAKTDMSDYDEDFVTVKKDELAKVITYYVGERFATDQADTSTLTIEDRIAADTDGKLIKAATGVSSRYVYKGEFVDNGHKLAIVQVSDTAVANT